jgi:RNA polymerase sigma-70 factor (ECF subfamily)
MSNRDQDDVVEHLGPLRRYARALTRDESQADDLVHDALVRAYERRSTFRLGAALKPWLFSILHNTFIDGQRRRTAERRREAEIAQGGAEICPPGQESSLRLEQIRRGFDALPEEQRAALHLVAIEGLAYQDAADTLNIPIGTLMSRLGRARAALRAFEEGNPVDRPRQLPAPAPRPDLPSSRPELPPQRPNLRVVGGNDD